MALVLSQATAKVVQAFEARVKELEGSHVEVISALEEAQKELTLLLASSAEHAAERSRLQQLLATAQGKATQVSELEQQTAALQSELATAKSALHAASIAGKDAVQRQLAVVSDEASHLRLECSQLRSERSELLQGLQDREASVAAVSTQNKALAKALAEAQAIIRTLQADCASAEHENSRLISSVRGLEASLSSAQQSSDRSTSECAQLKHKNADLTQALRELTARAQAEAEEASRFTRSLSARCEELGRDCSQMASELESTRKDSAQHKAAAAAAQGEVTKLASLIAQMQQRIRSVSEREAALEAVEAGAAQRIAQAGRERDLARSNEAAMKQELERYQATRRAEHQAAREAQEVAVSEVLQRTSAVTEADKAEITSLRSANGRLTQQLEQAAKDLASLRQAIATASTGPAADVVNLRASMEQLHAKLSAAERSRDEALHTSFRAEKEAQAKVAAAQADTQAMQARVAGLESTITTQSSDLATERSKARALQMRVDETRNECETLRTQLHSLQQSIATAIGSQTAAAEQKAAELLDANASLRQSLEVSQARQAASESTVSALQQDLDTSVRARVEQHVAVAEGKAEEAARLRARLTEVSLALQNLQREYVSAATAAHESEQSLFAVRAAYVNSQAVLSDVTAQLSASLAREDERSKALAEARAGAELAKLSCNRATARCTAVENRLQSVEKERDSLQLALAALGGAGAYAVTNGLNTSISANAMAYSALNASMIGMFGGGYVSGRSPAKGRAAAGGSSTQRARDEPSSTSHSHKHTSSRTRVNTSEKSSAVDAHHHSGSPRKRPARDRADMGVKEGSRNPGAAGPEYEDADKSSYASSAAARSLGQPVPPAKPSRRDVPGAYAVVNRADAGLSNSGEWGRAGTSPSEEGLDAAGGELDGRAYLRSQQEESQRLLSGTTLGPAPLSHTVPSATLVESVLATLGVPPAPASAQAHYARDIRADAAVFLQRHGSSGAAGASSSSSTVSLSSLLPLRTADSGADQNGGSSVPNSARSEHASILPVETLQRGVGRPGAGPPAAPAPSPAPAAPAEAQVAMAALVSSHRKADSVGPASMQAAVPVPSAAPHLPISVTGHKQPQEAPASSPQQAVASLLRTEHSVVGTEANARSPLEAMLPKPEAVPAPGTSSSPAGSSRTVPLPPVVLPAIIPRKGVLQPLPQAEHQAAPQLQEPVTTSAGPVAESQPVTAAPVAAVQEQPAPSTPVPARIAVHPTHDTHAKVKEMEAGEEAEEEQEALDDLLDEHPPRKSAGVELLSKLTSSPTAPSPGGPSPAGLTEAAGQAIVAVAATSSPGLDVEDYSDHEDAKKAKAPQAFSSTFSAPPASVAAAAVLVTHEAHIAATPPEPVDDFGPVPTIADLSVGSSDLGADTGLEQSDEERVQALPSPAQPVSAPTNTSSPWSPASVSRLPMPVVVRGTMAAPEDEEESQSSDSFADDEGEDDGDLELEESDGEAQEGGGGAVAEGDAAGATEEEQYADDHEELSGEDDDGLEGFAHEEGSVTPRPTFPASARLSEEQSEYKPNILAKSPQGQAKAAVLRSAAQQGEGFGMEEEGEYKQSILDKSPHGQALASQAGFVPQSPPPESASGPGSGVAAFPQPSFTVEDEAEGEVEEDIYEEDLY